MSDVNEQVARLEEVIDLAKWASGMDQVMECIFAEGLVQRVYGRELAVHLSENREQLRSTLVLLFYRAPYPQLLRLCAELFCCSSALSRSKKENWNFPFGNLFTSTGKNTFYCSAFPEI